MTKRSIFATVAAIFVSAVFFVGCDHALSEQGASISIALPQELDDAMARYAVPRAAMSRQTANAGDGSVGIIRIELTGGITRTEDFAWSGEESLICTMVNLPIGATVTVNVSALVDGVKLYETKNPPRVTITGGLNFTSVLLTPVALSVTITIDGDPADLGAIRVLSGGSHTVAVEGTLDDAALRDIAPAIKAISNGTTVSLDLSATMGLTSIGNAAFIHCTALAGITIPASVTSIGDFAFYGCTALTGITIPASVTSIGSLAFCDCTLLTSVTFETPSGWSYYTNTDQTDTAAADNPTANATNLKDVWWRGLTRN